ncbi:unnamed protein product [Haemonchus placei]|uniref:Tudor domain-containing protein n=1 Tax=Haemonchus placei TaxID=6290 RepID=A0A0N4X7X6_HAEPC|nr:unnamed protein product [Haemonchus placei]
MKQSKLALAINVFDEGWLYAKFNIDIGPVIRYQFVIEIPDDQNVVSPECFSAFSAAIIPKDEMLNGLVKLNLLDFKVMGHPIGLSK